MDILFWARKRANTEKVTIYARITIDGERAEFSTGITCLGKFWLGNDNLINTINPYHLELNTELEEIRGGLRRCFNKIRLDDEANVTADAVKEEYLTKKGGKGLQKTISHLVGWYQARKAEELKEKLIVDCTYKRHVRLSNQFASWYEKNYGTMPHNLNEVTLKEYIRHLKIQLKFKDTYINKHLDALRALMALAAPKGFVKTDEMRLIKKLKEPDPDKTHLVKCEIEKIEALELSGRMDRVRDQLLMLIELGTHVADYKRCLSGELYKDCDGDWWLFETRQKTNSPIQILLSEKALKILAKYEGLHNIPCISGQKFNDYIKVIGERAGIKKELTSKIGRKTFAHDKKNVKRLDDEAIAKMMALKSAKHLKHYTEMDLETVKWHWKKAG